MADMLRHTAAHTRHQLNSGHLLMGRRGGTPGTASPHRRPRRWALIQQLSDQQITVTTLGRLTLSGRAPRTTRQRTTAKHSADVCRSDAPARVAPGCPTYAAGTQQMRASLGSPTTRAIEHKH